MSEKFRNIDNCTNMFDEFGDAIADKMPYRDVTEFAQGAENADKVTYETFLEIFGHSIDEYLGESNEFLIDTDSRICMLYNADEDVHVFLYVDDNQAYEEYLRKKPDGPQPP